MKNAERSERNFPYFEDFYGNNSVDVYNKLVSTKFFSRDSKQKIFNYVNVFMNFLENKEYFSDSQILSKNHYNVDIIKKLVKLETYEDLANYSAQLTDGERRYFYSTELFLHAENQRKKLWGECLNILTNKTFIDRSNPINYDWSFVPIIDIRQRILLLEWGILTVKDFFFVDIPFNLLYQYLINIFNNNYLTLLTLRVSLKKHGYNFFS